MFVAHIQCIHDVGDWFQKFLFSLICYSVELLLTNSVDSRYENVVKFIK